MDQETLFINLESNDASQRSDALTFLRDSVRKNNGQLLCGNLRKLFILLKSRLADPNWSVRHQCVQCMADIIPEFGPDLISSMSIVLPTLTVNLGDSKVVVRKATVQVFQLYMKHSNNLEGVISTLLSHGFVNNDARVRQETISAVSFLFPPYILSKLELNKTIEALVGRLKDVSDDVVEVALHALEYIKNSIGDSKFCSVLENLSSLQKQLYETISKKKWTTNLQERKSHSESMGSFAA
eukprot:Sdes_comp16041_c0_seq1m5244